MDLLTVYSSVSCKSPINSTYSHTQARSLDHMNNILRTLMMTWHGKVKNERPKFPLEWVQYVFSVQQWLTGTQVVAVITRKSNSSILTTCALCSCHLSETMLVVRFIVARMNQLSSCYANIHAIVFHYCPPIPPGGWRANKQEEEYVRLHRGERYIEP